LFQAQAADGVRFLPAEELSVAVDGIEARDAELKRIRRLPSGGAQVAEAVRHVKGGGEVAFKLREIFALHALLPGRSDSVPALVHALSDEDWRVRRLAASGLGLLEAAVAVPDLVVSTTDGDQRVREAAAGALGRIGLSAAAAIPALRVVADEGGHAAWTAIQALKEIGASSALALAEIVGDRAGSARIFAANCLAELGPAAGAALPALEKVATEEKGDRDLWRAVRRAWRRINPGVSPPAATAPDWVRR
jgi:hypothetical protein